MVGCRLHTQAAVRVRLAVAAVCLIAAVGTAYGAGDTQQTTAPAAAAATAGTPVGTAADDGTGRRPGSRPDDNRSLLNYPFLFDVASAPIEVPLPVRVALLGFQGEGAHGVRLQASRLVRLLDHTLRKRTPAGVQGWDPAHTEWSWRPLGAVYNIQYEVVHIGGTLLAQYEQAVVAASTEASGSHEVLVDVKAHMLDGVLMRVYEAARTATDRTPTIIVANPDKKRIVAGLVAAGVLHDEDRPRGANDVARYRMSYQGGGFTQAWVGLGRFLALDLTAGPCQSGTLKAGEGSVLYTTVPRVEPSFAAAAHSHAFYAFVARLARTIALGVSSVLAPDVAVHPRLLTPFAERVVVPVVAFRDHDDFSPFRKGPGFIDLDAVEAQVRRVLRERQQLIVVPGSHHVADHPHVAQAIHQALRTDTVFAPGKSGAFESIHRESFDAKLLTAGLRNAADDLAGGLLVRRGAARDDPLLAVLHRGQGTGGASAGMPEEVQVAASAMDSLRGLSGTQLVPAYVLSLMRWPRHDSPEGKGEAGEGGASSAGGEPGAWKLPLFNHRSMLGVADDMITVLQLPTEHVELPWVSDGSPVLHDGRHPTKEVLAGLLQLVSGMAPPHRHFSPAHKRVVWDYLWANGAHPFAPFGESATLSQAMVDVARRNAVLVRLDAALQSARAAVHEVDEFAQKHLYDPFAEGADHAAPTRVWVDRLFHQSALKSPFANETITRLNNELEALAAQFVRAATVLATDQDKALELSAAIASATGAYHDYVHGELKRASDAMACCSTTHHIPSFRPNQAVAALWLASIVFLGVYVTWNAVKRRQRRRRFDW